MHYLTIQELINELQKAKYKDMPVKCLSENIDCGYVVKVYQGDTSVVLKLYIDDND